MIDWQEWEDKFKGIFEFFDIEIVSICHCEREKSENEIVDFWTIKSFMTFFSDITNVSDYNIPEDVDGFIKSVLDTLTIRIIFGDDRMDRISVIFWFRDLKKLPDDLSRLEYIYDKCKKKFKMDS